VNHAQLKSALEPFLGTCVRFESQALKRVYIGEMKAFTLERSCLTIELGWMAEGLELMADIPVPTEGYALLPNATIYEVQLLKVGIYRTDTTRLALYSHDTDELILFCLAPECGYAVAHVSTRPVVPCRAFPTENPQVYLRYGDSA
jgi:hypothetical protein